jgi:serine/threonine protein kinase
MNLTQNKLALREFRALSQVKNIRNPNLVTIHGIWLKDKSGSVSNFGDSGEPDSVWLKAHGDELVIAMDLGEETLADRLEKSRKAGLPGIPIRQLLDFMADAARGIDYLNQANPESGPAHAPIQHCDIKPHNLLLVGGCVKVCDFGLARAADVHARASSAGVATIAYSPPEYLVTAKASHSSDQYSLAVTYYELRTGRMPFKEPIGHYELISAIAEGKLDFSRLPSSEEKAVLRKATSVDPKERYGSCRELVRELRRAVGATDPRSGSSKEFFICPTAPGAGDEIVPHYHLVKRIGGGGFGEVWEATGPGETPAAIKIVSDLEGLAGHELQALELVKSVRHLHLLELHGYWLIDANSLIIPREARGKPDAPPAKRLVIATQLADQNLRQRLEECQHESGSASGIDPKELLHYMRQAAEAIDYLNSPRHRTSTDLHIRAIKPNEVSEGSGSARQAAVQTVTAGAKDEQKDSSGRTLQPSLRRETASPGGTTELPQRECSPESTSSELLLPLELPEEPATTVESVEKELHSIQHRDIKPENILLLGQDVKVADFGLAKVLQGSMAALRTQSSAITVAYAAPEFFYGNVTKWSDQYSLAIAYCHLRTGRLPFSGANRAKVMESHKQGKLDLSALSEAESRIIQRATALKPEDRYSTCTEMINELERAISPRAQPVSDGGNRWRWLVVAGLAAATIAVVCFLVFRPKPAPPPVDWMPELCRESIDSQINIVGTEKLRTRIEFYDKDVFKKNDLVIPFRLVERTPDVSVANFYMMENKVSNDLFQAALGDPDFQEILAKFEKDHPRTIRRKWEPKPKQTEARLPVFRVSAAEAYCFAAWLGGNLPTREQWDKAIGFYHLSRQNQTWKGFKEGPIAIGRTEPMEVGTAGGDVSVYSCRDMFGNGKEWTRDAANGKVGPANADPDLGVFLRGASFRSDKPFSLQSLAVGSNPLREKFGSTSEAIGFRVVLERR